MRIITPGTLLYIFLFLLILLIPQPVLAHGGEPRLEIGAERLNPGSVLELRGVDFESEEEVTLSLVGSQFEVALGAAAADTEGIFLLTIALPTDLAEGTYVIRATTNDHRLDSPEFMVWGVAPQNQEDSGIRDQSDVQLGAVPTFAPGVSATDRPASASMEATPPEAPTLPLILVAVGIGVLLLLGLVLLGTKK